MGAYGGRVGLPSYPAKRSGIWTPRDALFLQEQGEWPFPQDADPYYNSTVGIYNMQKYSAGGGCFDASPDAAHGLDWGAIGSIGTHAIYSTAQARFGRTSLLTSGTNDIIRIPTRANLNFSTLDWTLEGWWYFTSVTGTNALFDMRPGATNGFYPLVGFSATGDIGYYTNSAYRINSGAVFTTGVWYHIAVAKETATSKTRMFKDGVQVGADYADTNTYLQAHLGIGNSTFNASGTAPCPGYCGGLRLTRGVCRYTGTFTPPTYMFPEK